MKIFPPFFPKTIKKIIDRNTPRYYDLNGKQIPKPVKTISQPIQYDLGADTTATITNKGNAVIENETIKVTPSVVSEMLETKSKEYIIYCMKCKDKRILKNTIINKMETAKGIKYLAKGTCSVCGFDKCNGFVKG